MKNHSSIILACYKHLFRHFGPQGWWPTTPARGTRARYWPRRSPGSLTEREQLEVALGAILTQNTSWTNVEKSLEFLHQRAPFNVKSLLAIPIKTLEVLLYSSGYFRQKARRVRTFLSLLNRSYGGSLERLWGGDLIVARDRLLSFHGIGPETADSILLYAAGRPLFVVDAYTRRIGARWGVFKGNEPYAFIQRVFMSVLPSSPELYGEYHALLVRLAKDFCRKTPHCPGCPVQKLCKKGKMVLQGE